MIKRDGVGEEVESGGGTKRRERGEEEFEGEERSGEGREGEEDFRASED